MNKLWPVNKENLGKMDKYLPKHNSSTLVEQEIKNHNIPILIFN